MDNPPKPDLDPEEIERLKRVARVLARIEGWCLINRAIGKFIFFTVIGLLILLSQGLDAIKNLLGMKH